MLPRAVAAAMALGLALTGCSSSNNNSSSTTGATGGSTATTGGTTAASYRVAYVARAQSDSFAAWLANEIKAEAAKYPDITLEVFDGQADDDKENTMIENAIANKFDAIIVQPNNGEAQRPYVEKIVAAGIHCITTNARIAGIDGCSSIDANPYDQGAGPAKLALTQVPQNAKVVVLNGPSGNFHTIERRKAWQAEFFDKRPDVKIVAEDIANWNKDEGLNFMQDWIIAYGKIDAIISMNDNMAAGALEAVGDKADLQGILAYGVDGTPEATLLIKDGKMTATALQSAIDLAKLNVAAVHDLLTGKQTMVEDNVPAPVITKDNVQQYIDMYTTAGLLK
jgi:inositol transport system substrate-binding protein